MQQRLKNLIQSMKKKGSFIQKALVLGPSGAWLEAKLYRKNGAWMYPSAICKLLIFLFSKAFLAYFLDKRYAFFRHVGEWDKWDFNLFEINSLG